MQLRLPLRALAFHVLMMMTPAGCHAGAIDARADEQLADLHARTERTFVYPSCRDGSPIGGNCGLYMKRASTAEFRELFREKKCAGKSDDECERVYRAMIDAWFEQRYVQADWHKVTLYCNGNPGRCDDPIAYELVLLDSHNARVRRDLIRAENVVEEERKQAHLRDTNETLAGAAVVTAGLGGGIKEGLHEAAYQFHEGPKCKSYPSVSSGMTYTLCQ